MPKHSVLMSTANHTATPVVTSSRRSFVRAAAAGGLGAALVTGPLRAVHATGAEEPIKVALVGCGGRGTGAAADALATSSGPVMLWAMADAFSDRLESSLGVLARQETDGVAAKLDVPPERRFVGLDAYRKAIDSGADVVILTGPPGFRPLHLEYAVNAGKHVFCEKPLATDPAGVRRVLAAAEEAARRNLKVGVGLQRHHQPSYREAIQRIADGQIGRVRAMRCYWNTAAPAKTPVTREHSASELQHQVRNWYFFDWLSGDHIVEQHIHNLDVCNWVHGRRPVSAHGMGGRQVRTAPQYGNIFDHHAVEFAYDDGIVMQSFCRQIPGCRNEVREVIVGTDGEAELSAVACRLTAGGSTVWETERARKADHRNPYRLEHEALFAAIREDRPHAEAVNGALSTMTAVLGRLASYSGKEVTWEEALASQRVLTTDAESWDAEPPLRPENDGSYRIPTPGVARVL